MQHVPDGAGSVVFFDNRIVHSNSYRRNGSTPRCVVIPTRHNNKPKTCSTTAFKVEVRHPTKWSADRRPDAIWATKPRRAHRVKTTMANSICQKTYGNGSLAMTLHPYVTLATTSTGLHLVGEEFQRYRFWDGNSLWFRLVVSASLEYQVDSRPWRHGRSIVVIFCAGAIVVFIFFQLFSPVNFYRPGHVTASLSQATHDNLI